MSSEAPEEILFPATNGETTEEPEDAELMGEDPMSGDINENEQDIFAGVAEEAEDTAEVEGEVEYEAEAKSPNPNKGETEPTTAVVPKKRKTSVASSPPESEATTEPKTIEKSANSERSGPSTSRAAAAVKEDHVDENQCRVCTTKDDLVSLFKKTEQNNKTIADLLMQLCPAVNIAQKDFMPQFVCYPCFGKINLAMQLKAQCEKTESELRKKLSRHKNKVRRPAGYVVVDAPLDSDPESEEEPNDDVEFKVSEASAEEDDDEDSDDSDFSGKKRPGRGRGVRRKSAATPSIKPKKSKPIKREAYVETNAAGKAKKTKKTSESDSAEKPEFRCDECDSVFTRKVSLVLHKRTHITEKSLYWCELCGKQFKIQGAYRSHLEKHKNETNGFACEKCDEIYVSNADLKRHLAEDHNEQGLVYTCNKCKRTFVSQSRLRKHSERCPGMPKKKSEFDGFPLGQDLFKTVAPLTSTYWSDSFSD